MAVEQNNKRTDEQGMTKCVLNLIGYHFIIPCSLLIGLLFVSCTSGNAYKHTLLIQSNNKGQPEAILVHRSLLPHSPDDFLLQQLHVYLAGADHTTPILGTNTGNSEFIVIHPLIAFTRGLSYEVRLNDQLIDTIRIPAPSAAEAPSVVAVYPTQDTLPQNLLKFYIRFSKPMQEGKALENIFLLKNGKDTVPAVFLDLQPELWNNDRTLLTVWFDPGRIKRDLQPNKAMGPPLTAHTKYQLVIDNEWAGETGASLKTIFRKDFITTEPDYISPDIKKWQIALPMVAEPHYQSLTIFLREALDHELLINTVRVVDGSNKIVPGKFSISGDTTLNFFSDEWKRGTYTIEVESRLEDLAGNNLNHPFDNDLDKKQVTSSKEVYKRIFTIE